MARPALIVGVHASDQALDKAVRGARIDALSIDRSLLFSAGTLPPSPPEATLGENKIRRYREELEHLTRAEVWRVLFLKHATRHTAADRSTSTV